MSLRLHLPRHLGALAKLCADESTRYSMTGLRLTDPGDGLFRVDVTDGRKAAVVQGVSLLADGPRGEPDSLVVPARKRRPSYKGAADGIAAGWLELFRGTEDTPVVVERADERTVRITSGGEFVVPLVEGHYPDVNQALPKGPPAFAIKVNPAYLAELLLAADATVCDDAHRSVTLLFYRRNVPLGILARNPTTGLTFDGILMPLT